MSGESTRATHGRRKTSRRTTYRLRLLAMLAALSLAATSGFADYVGSLTVRIFLDPATVPAIIDGYQNGDEIAYILETTPRNTGSTNGVAAWMTLYVPAGVEVIGASFVTQAGDGSWLDIPAEDGDTCWLDCGQRGCNRFDLTSGTLRVDDGAINEVNHDSGIFYSTDSRTAISTVPLTPSIEVTGAQTKPAVIFNQWDYDQCKAFGMKRLGGANASALSGNLGKGNTPVISLDSGTTWAGTGSMVAGPQTFYTNDYNPACDCNGGCPGSSSFPDEIQCAGPWHRITYPNSKLATSGSVSPSTTASSADGNTSVVTGSGVVLSSISPLPANTNAVRWVHGVRTLGELEHGRVTFRITNVAAFLATFTNDTFCLESTGGDTSDVRGKDNPWRYYEPEHKCFAALGGPGADAVLLKQVLFVDGDAGSGAFLSAGDVISWRVTFTNTSGGALTGIVLEDTPDTNVALVEPGSEALCAYPSYDGDLPGPAYAVGSITGTGTASWAAIPTLAAGASVTVRLCGKVSAGVMEGDVVKNTAKVTYTLPDLSVKMQTSSTVGTVANCTNDGDCSDADACTGFETCVLGQCQPGTPPVCNDGNPCTIDSCDPTASCINVLKDCSDAIACTTDSCNPSDGTCTHQPTDGLCANGQFCDGAEVCNPTTGCEMGTPPDCSDSIACTTDTCDEVNDVCVHAPSNAYCNDGVACTTDICDVSSGGCVSKPSDAACDDDDHCDGDETCNPLTGCQPGSPPDCDDAVPCTVDTCNETTDSCDHTPSDGSCSDGLFCNGVETCDGINGCQAGTPVNCDDGIPCTIDACDESTDTCTHTPNASVCDDGAFCDGVELCVVGVGCQAGPPPNCNDGVSCTEDSCDETNDACVNAPYDGSCSDGQFCNGNETCDPVNGCTAGTPPNCGDAVGCTVDSCDEVNDVCVNTPDDSACYDGEFCDGDETCDPINGCLAGTPPNCNDGVGCTVDSCDETNDVCVHAPSDGACGDGQFCNGVETCDAVNDCQAGTPPNCDDGVGCTVDSCDEMKDVCEHAPTDSLCTDGAFCNGVETCDAVGDCQAGTPPNCNDGVSCTTDTCNEVTDSCDHAPVDSLCSDGQFCNGNETCDPINDCQIGTPPNCGDAVPCTVDTCDEVNDVCVNAPNDSACDDGAFCNGSETCDSINGCQAGTAPNCNDGVVCTVDACDEVNDVCVNTPTAGLCSNGLFCDGVETCDSINGCQPGTSPNCDDGVVCTDDSCDEANDTCVNTPNDAHCTDGQFCTGVETCDPINGCQPGSNPCPPGLFCDEVGDACVDCLVNADCDDGLHCNGSETCVAGTCAPGTPPNCDDAVSCTVDTCDEVNDVCVHTPTDSLCNDGAFCNGVETCNAITDCQAGTAPNCDDAVSCTVDTCDEVNDVCAHAPTDSLCNDNQFCNGVETCDALHDCQPGVAPNCDDGVGCTLDACDELNDLCTHGPQDSLCSDGQFCTGVETCDALNDCQPGTPPNCNDNVGCTVDSCDEINDVCVNGPDDSACNDLQFCNGVETCDPVNGCLAGTAPNCDDTVSCTVDACDEVNDVCTHLPQDALCSNGQFCDGAETCDVLNDCQAGTAPNCDDAVSCTVDACDEIKDVCAHAPQDSLCSDGAFCNGVETCDVLNDCQAGTPPNCKDGVTCTIDGCDETNDVCTNVPNNAICNDGQFCNGVETCDVLNDCQAGTPPNCGDGVGCTVDTCDEVNDVCAHAPDNAACDDSQFCNGIETCDALNGCLAGTAPNCDDAVSCTNDSCNEQTDQCDHAPDDGLCGDGQFCNGVETCDAINDCQPGTAPNCDDAVSCTDDACNEVTDQCDHAPNDTLCNDGQFCNGVETCDLTNDCQAGTPPTCNDAVSCTVDSCNELTDQCDHAADNAACDDGQFCNGVEFCDPATGCDAGAPPDCGDGVVCTMDSCDETNDRCRHLLSDLACEDGNECTSDTCTLTGCTHDALCGACCLRGGGCLDATSGDDCEGLDAGIFLGVGSSCLGDSDGDGFDDACPAIIPTVSEWGLVILTLLLCVGAKVYFGRRAIVVA